MANPDVTAFVDDAAVTAAVTTETRAPAASFTGGCNATGSNAPGIGINQGGGAVVGTPEQFTLLDQFGDARTAQKSQLIGGTGITLAANWPSSGGAEGTLPDAVIRFGPQDAAYPDGSGDITFTSNSTLAVLATGWEAAAP
jgi:hypothetical protein